MDAAAEHALELAARSLARRDRSRRALEEQLARAGVDPDAAAQALDELAEAGYLDERRLAGNRARALAERHYGDEAIVGKLAAEGFCAAEIEQAVAELAPEADRARGAMAAVRGGASHRYRALARRGYSDATIEAVTAFPDGDDMPALA